MGLLILILTGGIVGWLASILARAENQQEILLNGVAGIVGALLFGLVGGGIAAIEDFSLTTLLLSFLGALVTVSVALVLRRSTVSNR